MTASGAYPWMKCCVLMSRRCHSRGRTNWSSIYRLSLSAGATRSSSKQTNMALCTTLMCTQDQCNPVLDSLTSVLAETLRWSWPQLSPPTSHTNCFSTTGSAVWTCKYSWRKKRSIVLELWNRAVLQAAHLWMTVPWGKRMGNTWREDGQSQWCEPLCCQMFWQPSCCPPEHMCSSKPHHTSPKIGHKRQRGGLCLTPQCSNSLQ